MTARRHAAGDFFDDASLKFVKGSKKVRLPDGDLLWHIRLTPGAVELTPSS